MGIPRALREISRERLVRNLAQDAVDREQGVGEHASLGRPIVAGFASGLVPLAQALQDLHSVGSAGELLLYLVPRVLRQTSEVARLVALPRRVQPLLGHLERGAQLDSALRVNTSPSGWWSSRILSAMFSMLPLLFSVLFDSGRLDSLGPLVGPSLGAWVIGPVLSGAGRTAAAGEGLEDLDLFTAHFDQAAYVDDALVAGVGTGLGGRDFGSALP